MTTPTSHTMSREHVGVVGAVWVRLETFGYHILGDKSYDYPKPNCMAPPLPHQVGSAPPNLEHPCLWV